MVDFNNLSKIESIVKFNQTEDPSYPSLEADLIASANTPIIFQELHPLLTIKNIYHAIAYENNTIDSSVLSRKLREAVKGSIKSALQNTIISQIANEDKKSLLESYKIHDSVGDMRSEVFKRNRFVGYRIEVSPNKGVKTIARRLGLQLSEAQELNIYCFHPSSAQPLTVQAVDYTTARKLQWFDINIEMSPDEYDYDYFYIGYFERDLVGNAIYREIGSVRSGCNCRSKEMARFDSKFAKALSISVEEGSLSLYESFDNASASIQSLNFGLNLELDTVCELNRMVNENSNIFAIYIRKQITVDFLRILAFSVENSGISQRLKNEATFALRGENGNGLEKDLDNTYKAFSYDLSYLDSPCFGSQSGGVSINSI